MYQYLNDVEKRRIFGVVFTALILLCVFLGIKSLNSLKENKYIGRGTYATNVISVTGKGEAVTVPDVGLLSFSVVETGKTVKEAQDKATNKTNGAIDALKALGIAEKDIKTESYNSYPKYEYSQNMICANGYCPPSKQLLVGYEVSESISVKIRKTDNAGNVLTKIGSLGVSNFSGLSFVVDDMTSVQAEARDKAIQDAKDKAVKLSKSLGVKLGKIVNFDENGAMPIYYGMAGKSMDSVAPQASSVPDLPTGENKVTSNVTITYEVE
jgi:uncharacterized protein YggE